MKKATSAKNNPTRIEDIPDFLGVKVKDINDLYELVCHLKVLISDKNQTDQSTQIQSHIINDGFFIRQNCYQYKILFNDILWIEAARSYSYINLTNEKKILTTHPLSFIETYLSPIIFKRIHRSFIVNLNHISSFYGNMVCIRKKKIPISQSNRKSLKAYFIFLE